MKLNKEEDRRLKGPHKPNPGRHTEAQTTINLIENQTRVRTYWVTRSLNHDVSNLILDTIFPIIQMRMRVIYSFSCLTYRGRNQIVEYHRTLPTNDTFTSLSQIEEYIRQCELQHLNLDDEGVWSKAYLPVMRITNNPGVYEGHVEFRHVQVQLISLNEPLLGCSPLPNWLRGERCIYSIDNTDDNLCVCRCLVISERLRRNWQRPEEDTTREALNLVREFYNQPKLRVRDVRATKLVDFEKTSLRSLRLTLDYMNQRTNRLGS